jgi:hypothetical protein
VDPADRVDARQASSDPQRVGDPLGLDERFHVEIELEVDLGRDRPLGDEQLGIGIARPSQIASDQLAQTPEVGEVDLLVLRGRVGEIWGAVAERVVPAGLTGVSGSKLGVRTGGKLAWKFQPCLEVPTQNSAYTPGKSR